MSYFVQLRTFVEVYRCLNISRAAKNLGLSQPAATAHIQSVESTVGKTLFTRRHRGVEPTNLAHELAAQIGGHFDAIEQKMASTRSRSSEVRGTITLAGPAEYISYVASAQLANLLQGGHVDVSILPGNREQIYSALDNGVADLAITASLPDSSMYDYQVLDSERLMLVTHKLLADSLPTQEMDANLLNTLPVVAYSPQLPLIREYFDVVFKAHCRSQIIATCPDIRALAGIVRTGVGYSVLPDYLCYDDLRSGRLVSLGPEGPENNIYLAWRKGALAHPRVNYARDILMAFSNINRYAFHRE
ncbi:MULTISPECIES: LysR family transcriptional regulator [unclassified Pseudoalteromonas]|uniref:LysR family transcriptional regulator n=1 Tax=unclassified Pseudoalteromonas TaxID=194690 RepID=UPI000CF73A78|nr:MULTISPECIES: LysR family transcriptional regulator [unclassified Pseudoalteromonas]